MVPSSASIDEDRKGAASWTDDRYTSLMKWTRRILLVILLALLLGVVVQLVRWGQARKSDPDATLILPRVYVARMSVEQLDPDTTLLNIMLAIDDPAPIGLTVDSLEYVMSIGGNEVVRSTYPHSITVRANDSAHIELPVAVQTRKLVAVLKQLAASGVDTVEYAMESKFHWPLAFWREKPLSIKIARRLPLFLIPEVEVRDPVVEKLGLGESRVVIDVAIFNPNGFSFAFRQPDFEAELNGHEVVTTVVDDLVQVPARDTVIVRVPMVMAPGRLLGGLFGLIVKPARTTYSYRMALTIVSDNATLDKCRFVVVGNGMLEELKSLRKAATASK